MPDDKSKRGEADRRLVSSEEGYEVAVVAKAFGVTAAEVREVIAKVGNRRVDIEAELERRTHPLRGVP